MKKKLLLLLISLTTVSAVGITFYYDVLQRELLADGPIDPGGPIGSIVPIDGGLSLLMVTGAALGAKRVRDHLRKKKSNDGSQ